MIYSMSVISSVLFLSVWWITCQAQNPALFPQCIGQQSPGGRPDSVLQRIYAPDSPTYASILKLSSKNYRWFNSTSQRPFLIVAPRLEDEIRPIITCSIQLGHQIRVKSGGHDYEGLSFRSETPFIMVDVSNLNSTTIDLKEETAWIQSGVTLGQLYYEIGKKSKTLAFPAGLFASVGSGGHISGGGLGTLMRKYGLAADNVLDARIMDVHGRILNRKSMGEDLFWAIRGGGGASFGVILAWKLKLVRVPEIVTGFTIHRKLEPENLDILQKWQNTAYKLSDDVSIRLLVQPRGNNMGPGNEKFVQLGYQGMFLGAAEELVSFLKVNNFSEFDLKPEDCFGPQPAVNMNCPDKPCNKISCSQASWIQSVLYFLGRSVNDPLETLLQKNTYQNNFYKATSDFLNYPIPDEGWNMIREMFLIEDAPTMILDPFGGRMDEISENETPFPHRKGNIYNVQYLTNWNVNSNTEISKHIAWIRDLYEKMTPYVAQSPRTAYLNYKDLDLGRNDDSCSYDQARIWGEKYFKGNFERLSKVKTMVDPENFFRNEQSIPVSAGL